MREIQIGRVYQNVYKGIAVGSAIMVLGIGLTGFAGWLFGAESLKQVVPGFVSMKTNTSLGLILCGACLLFLTRADTCPLANWSIKMLSSLVVLLGLLTVLQDLFSINLGIDELFFVEENPFYTGSPNRMSIFTAISFVFSGLAFWLESLDRNPLRVFLSQLFLFFVGFISILGFASYLLGAPLFYHEFTRYTNMAVHTLLAFILVFVAGFFHRIEEGVGSVLLSKGPAGTISRVLLLTTPFVFLIFGIMANEGFRLSFFGIQHVLAVVFTCSIMYIWFAVILLSRYLEKMDVQREKLTAELKVKEAFLKESNEEVICQNEELHEVNQALLETNEELTRLKYDLENRVYDRTHQLEGKNLEIAMQLSELERLNRELIEAKEKAEESDRLKSAFLANMSHEIRTPLNGILGFSGFIIQDDMPREKKEAFAKLIHNCGYQLINIIDDLIDVAKIEANQVKINPTRINLNTLLDELFLQFEEKVEARGLNFSMSKGLPDAKSFFVTDATRLRQVFSNLLSNAVKFTHSGEVEFGYTVRDESLECFVKDTGIGIPDEMHEQIFERFRQLETSNTRNYGGNGLGLSISKALVQMMGGKIWVRSSLGSGSEFYFSLPLIENGRLVKEKDISHEKSEQEMFDGIPEGKDKLILVVEDEDTNYLYLKEILDEYQFPCLHARDGQEAIEFIQRYPGIKLVLMDLKMPKMDGFASTLEIKRINRAIPVIAQSAYAYPEDKEKALACGCDDFLVKPMMPGKLIDKINKFLGQIA